MGQIDEMVSECPKIMKISKSSLYAFMCPKVALNPMRTSKKCFAHGLWVFRPLFDRCSGHFDAKNTYFDVFFMFSGAVGVHKNPKKSKSPNMSLNTPKLS